MDKEGQSFNRDMRRASSNDVGPRLSLYTLKKSLLANWLKCPSRLLSEDHGNIASGCNNQQD